MYEEIRDHGRLESGWPLVPGQVCSGQDLGEVSLRSHQAPVHWTHLYQDDVPSLSWAHALPCRVGNHPVVGVEEAGVGSRTVQWEWG